MEVGAIELSNTFSILLAAAESNRSSYYVASHEGKLQYMGLGAFTQIENPATRILPKFFLPLASLRKAMQWLNLYSYELASVTTKGNLVVFTVGGEHRYASAAFAMNAAEKDGTYIDAVELVFGPRVRNDYSFDISTREWLAAHRSVMTMAGDRLAQTTISSDSDEIIVSSGTEYGIVKNNLVLWKKHLPSKKWSALFDAHAFPLPITEDSVNVHVSFNTNDRGISPLLVEYDVGVTQVLAPYQNPPM